MNKPSNNSYCVNNCNEYEYRIIDNLRSNNNMGYYVDLSNHEIKE